MVMSRGGNHPRIKGFQVDGSLEESFWSDTDSPLSISERGILGSMMILKTNHQRRLAYSLTRCMPDGPGKEAWITVTRQIIAESRYARKH